MVAFSGFNESHKPPPSGNVRGIVPQHRHGHRSGQQSGYMLHPHFVDRVVAQCWRPVASGEALVMLHRLMCSVWHQHTVMVIVMARDGGAFVCRRRLFQLL